MSAAKCKAAAAAAVMTTGFTELNDITTLCSLADAILLTC